MLFPESDPRSRALRRVASIICMVLAVVLSFIVGAEISAQGYWRAGTNATASETKKTDATAKPNDTQSDGTSSGTGKSNSLKGTDFVVIGDSYHAPETSPYHEAAEQLADLSGLTVHNYAVGGAGWLASVSHSVKSWTFGEQIDQAVDDSPAFASKTAFVLISGGYNDANLSDYDSDHSALAKEMTSGFAKLKKAFPKAKIVYIPYLRANNPMQPHYFDMDTVEFAVKTAKKAKVAVAPYAWEWNLGQDQYFDANRDPVHPSSEAGFRYMAQKEWDVIRGKKTSRSSVDKTFTGVTSDGWLKYEMEVKLKNGVVDGTITLIPNSTSSPDGMNSLYDYEEYRQLTPNSSLWNAFDGESKQLAGSTRLKVSTGISDSDDAFVLDGSGTLQKGKKYKVSFHARLDRGDWSAE